MDLYGSSYALCSISRKGNSCIKRNSSFEEEMEILPCEFFPIFFLFLDSTPKDLSKPINKLLLQFYGVPFKCTNKYFVSKKSNAGEFFLNVYSNEKIDTIPFKKWNRITRLKGNNHTSVMHCMSQNRSHSSTLSG